MNSLNTIHITSVQQIMRNKEMVDLQYLEKSGKMILIKNCYLISEYRKQRTFKVMIDASKCIRQLRWVCCFKINNQRIIL